MYRHRRNLLCSSNAEIQNETPTPPTPLLFPGDQLVITLVFWIGSRGNGDRSPASALVLGERFFPKMCAGRMTESGLKPQSAVWTHPPHPLMSVPPSKKEPTRARRTFCVIQRAAIPGEELTYRPPHRGRVLRARRREKPRAPEIDLVWARIPGDRRQEIRSASSRAR